MSRVWLLSLSIAVAAGSSIAGEGIERLYALPEAGSYDLPVIDHVGHYVLLDTEGKPSDLPGVQPGECAVVSFVYATCPDAQGCPLLLATMRRLDHALSADPELAKRVHLVSVSFDPQHDTPEQLRMLRGHMNPTGDWRFLSAASDAELKPVLEDYGQDTQRLVARESGEATPLIRHVAKVYLVDGRGGIRNIYSSGFLDHEILLRDIETVLLADATPAASRDGR